MKRCLPLFLVFLGLTGCARHLPNLPETTKPQVCIEKNCFHTEIAETLQQHEYGLMNRTTMPIQSGMIFVFPEEKQYTFWMKNTLIPLDMIRIDSGMNIVGIEEAAPCLADPCPIFNPGKPATYVLEINKWLSKQRGIQEGQKVIIKK